MSGWLPSGYCALAPGPLTGDPGRRLEGSPAVLESCAAPHALRRGAGTLFWKWALSPKNPREDYLEVAVPDPTFTDIVVPGAKAALDWAKKASPVKNCQKVPHLPVSPLCMVRLRGLKQSCTFLPHTNMLWNAQDTYGQKDVPTRHHPCLIVKAADAPILVYAV